MRNDRNHTDILLEEMRDDIKTILEIVVPMRYELNEVKRIIADIPEMKADIKTIKLALTDTNKQVRDHEHRITRLEAVAP